MAPFNFSREGTNDGSSTTSSATATTTTVIPKQPVRHLAQKLADSASSMYQRHDKIKRCVDGISSPALAAYNSQLGQRVVSIADAGLNAVDGQVERHAPKILSIGEKLKPMVAAVEHGEHAVHDLVTKSASYTQPVYDRIVQIAKDGIDYVLPEASENEMLAGEVEEIHSADNHASEASVSTPSKSKKKQQQESAMSHISRRIARRLDFSKIKVSNAYAWMDLSYLSSLIPARRPRSGSYQQQQQDNNNNNTDNLNNNNNPTLSGKLLAKANWIGLSPSFLRKTTLGTMNYTSSVVAAVVDYASHAPVIGTLVVNVEPYSSPIKSRWNGVAAWLQQAEPNTSSTTTNTTTAAAAASTINEANHATAAAVAANVDERNANEGSSATLNIFSAETQWPSD